eukprot:2997624-Pyramimonas_sp.AAC.1
MPALSGHAPSRSPPEGLARAAPLRARAAVALCARGQEPAPNGSPKPMEPAPGPTAQPAA